MSANVTSVRLAILNAMQQTFTDVQENKPPADPYGVTFSTVALGPLAPFDQKKRYSLGLAMGPEKETFQFPFIMCFMTVNLELRITVNKGDNPPGQMIEELITVVKRVVGDNRQWGGLAIDSKIVGTEVDLETYWDRSALAVVKCEVQYRYSSNDPRSQNSDA